MQRPGLMLLIGLGGSMPVMPGRLLKSSAGDGTSGMVGTLYRIIGLIFGVSGPKSYVHLDLGLVAVGNTGLGLWPKGCGGTLCSGGETLNPVIGRSFWHMLWVVALLAVMVAVESDT